MNIVKKTMMAYGVLASALLAQTNIDRLLTDEANWAKSAKAVAAEFSDFEWDTSEDNAILKNKDVRLWNRDVDGFDMLSKTGFLRSLNVLIDTTHSKSEFSDTLEEWVAVFDVNLNVDHSKEAFKAKDGGKSTTYRWKQDSYYVYLTGAAKEGVYTTILEYRIKVVTDQPARVLAEKDRFDGIYERNFYTPDYSKSFKGRIVGFDQGEETISVKTKKSTMTVPLDKLSERDLAYYEEIKDLVIASQSLSISIKETKEKAERIDKSINVKTKFGINLANRSPQAIKNIEVKYVTYYKLDSLDGPPVLTARKGSIDVDSLLGNYRKTLFTETIVIVRESKDGVSGG